MQLERQSGEKLKRCELDQPKVPGPYQTYIYFDTEMARCSGYTLPSPHTLPSLR